MKGINKYLFLLSVILLAGCSQEEEQGVPGEVIRLESSGTIDIGLGTRAAGNFPNNGSIGIITTRTYDPANPLATDWTSHPDISNVEATALAENNGVYSFSWVNQKYWPFDGSDLYFMAYSPISKGDLSYYTLSNDNTTLYLALHSGLPDIMYADGNLSPQPYNKASGVVNLGEFRHILSRLMVRVVADTNMSTNIVLKKLTVSTKLSSATYRLDSGDNGLDVITNTNDYIAKLAEGTVDFKSQTFTNSLYLFPDTHEDVKISITLGDTSNNLEYLFEYPLSFFLRAGAPVTLNRAQTTVLTINVQTVSVQNPEQSIQLEGAITDWDYQGDFGIIIN